MVIYVLPTASGASEHFTTRAMRRGRLGAAITSHGACAFINIESYAGCAVPPFAVAFFGVAVYALRTGTRYGIAFGIIGRIRKVATLIFNRIGRT
jgi:hypothetical protein